MVPSEACYSLARRFESLRCSAYVDPVGIPTIGYGHCGCSIGDSCTPEQADGWLIDDMAQAAALLDPYPEVVAALSQPQFDALLDILFNVGPGRPDLATLKGRDGIIWLARLDAGRRRHSTLFMLLSRGQFKAAADEFLQWNHAGGVVMPGLTARRQAERELFLSGTVGA